MNNIIVLYRRNPCDSILLFTCNTSEMSHFPCNDMRYFIFKCYCHFEIIFSFYSDSHVFEETLVEEKVAYVR